MSVVRRGLGITAAVVALAAIAVPTTGTASSAGTAAKAKSVKVKVEDDFYSESKLSVKKNTKVSFKWDSSNLNTHNVTFKSGPKGVKKSKKPCAKGSVTKCNVSASGSIGINFAPTFDKKGTYDFQCTIHPDLMKIKVTVK